MKRFDRQSLERFCEDFPNRNLCKQGFSWVAREHALHKTPLTHPTPGHAPSLLLLIISSKFSIVGLLGEE